MIISEEKFTHLYGERSGTTCFMRSFSDSPHQAEVLFRLDRLGKRLGGLAVMVIGCSTGQEVYSYALMCEANGFKDYTTEGCDVTSAAITCARKGTCHLNWEGPDVFDTFAIPKELYRIEGKAPDESRDFRKVTIADHVRAHTQFFQHDISLEPLPKTYDVVACNNTLPQPQRGERDAAVQNVVSAVKPEGFIISNHGYLFPKYIVQKHFLR